MSSWQIVGNCRRSSSTGIPLPEADLSDSYCGWLLLQRCWSLIRIEMKMTRANVTLLLFSSCAQEKLSAELNGASDCPCSRASPGNKSGIKRIFSIATKMASKAADGDKKTWKEPPPHLQAWPDICLDSLIHSLAPIVNATDDASHPLLFLHFLIQIITPWQTNKYLSVFTILMQSLPLSLIMRKSRGDLWEPEKLDFGIFWQNCHRMTSYVPLKRGKPISDICNFTTMTNNDGGQ